MATKVQPKIAINIDEIKNSPNYQVLIDRLNVSPLQAYKELTVLEETDNQMSKTKGGIGLIKELKSRLNVSPDEIKQEFYPTELPEELKTKIDVNPEDTYKNLYNAYTYEPGNTQNKLQLRKGLSSVREYLISKGHKPDEFLVTNPVVKGLNVLSNIFMLGTNALAKIYTKNPERIKLWGGNGAEEAIKDLNANPEIQNIISKRVKNIPLTGDEIKKIKKFDNKTGIVSFVVNLFADPLIIAGLGAKAIKGISGGIGALGKIGKGLEIISAPIKTFKEAKTLATLKETGEFADILKSSLKQTKNVLTGIKDSEKYIVDIDNILANPETLYNKSIDLLKQSSEFLKGAGKSVESEEILKSYSAIKKTVGESKRIAGSKLYQKAVNFDDKFQNIKRGFIEKSGLRQVFKSDTPLYKEISSVKDGKIIKEWSPTGYKIELDKVKNIKMASKNAYYKARTDVTKELKSLIPKLKNSNTVKALLNSPNSKFHSVDDIIMEISERHGDMGKLLKLEGAEKEALFKVRKAYDNMIMKEVEFGGDKVMPLFKDITKRNDWKDLSKKYKELGEVNKYHPEYIKIENKLRSLLSESSGVNFIDKTLLDETEDNIAYVTHAMTKEAKTISQNISSSQRGLFYKGFRSYLSNPNWKGRKLGGSAVDINQKIMSGEITTELDGVLKGIADKKILLEKSLKGKSKKTIEGIKKKIEELTGDEKSYTALRDNMKNFKGKKFFETDVNKLLDIRAATSVKTIEKAAMFNSMQKFGVSKEMAETGWKSPNVGKTSIVGLSDKYFDPEVAKTIEKVYNYTSNAKNMNVLNRFIMDFGNFWKATTLSTHLSTGLRNVIGDIALTAIVVDDVPTLMKATKDAVMTMMTKGTRENVRFVTETGKYVNAQDVFEEFLKRGGQAGTFRAMDTARTEFLADTATSTTGKMIEGAGNMMEKWSKWFRDLPPAQLSELFEKGNKLALFFYGVRKGKSYDDAMKQVNKVLFDYSDLTDIEKSIKQVMPFYCVPDYSEILTKDGWKFYNEISKGDEIISYNVKKDILENDCINDIAIFNYEDKLIRVSNKLKVEFVFTNNHRWATINNYGKREIIEYNKMNTAHNIPLSAEYNNINKGINLTFEECYLLGWLVTDGYFRKRKNSYEAMLYQKTKKHVKMIRETFKDYISSEYKHPDTGVICFRLKAKMMKNIFNIFKSKEDLPKLITRMNIQQLKNILQAMQKGDGADNEIKGSYFGQNIGGVLDAFQVGTLLNGNHFNIIYRNNLLSNKIYGVGYIRNTKLTNFRNYKQDYIDYKGIIWCPKTNNQTWIMRQKGKVIITGNTWLRKNLPLQLASLNSAPTKAAFKMYKSANEIRPSTDVQDERMQSEFLKDRAKIRLPDLKTGEANYLFLEGLLPTFDLTRVIRDLSHNQLQNTVDDLIADVTPLIKTPIELAVNRSFAFKTELQKSKYEKTQFLGFNMNPRWKALMDDWRLLTTLNKGLDLNPDKVGIEPKSISKMWLSYLIASPTEYNPYYSKIFATRDATSAIQDELGNYKSWMTKIKGVMLSGKKLTSQDVAMIRERGKNILMMIKEAKDNGMTDSKATGMFTKNVLSNFMDTSGVEMLKMMGEIDVKKVKK